MVNEQGSGGNEFTPPPEHTEATTPVNRIEDADTLVNIEATAPADQTRGVDQTTTEPVTPAIPSSSKPAPRSASARFKAGWTAFRLWRLQRPFWGSILMFLASLLFLYGPLSLLGYMFLPGSAVPVALTVGALMLVMSLAQLFVPAHALITGLIGIVLSIASLITGSFGGLGIGMILGILGSAQGVAWKAKARPLPTKRSSAQSKGRRSAAIAPPRRSRLQRGKGGQLVKQP